MLRRPLISTAILVLATGLVHAGDWTTPTALEHADEVAGLEALPRIDAPRVDLDAVRAEDEERGALGLPERFAIVNPVRITPADSGLWEELDDGSWLWRLQVASTGAPHLNLGFTRYTMPLGGRLLIYAADLSEQIRPFTWRDNADHGELWTPVIRTAALVIEVTVPDAVRDRLVLELGSVNVGYRGFGAKDDSLASGACNIDVVCPIADPWRSEIPAIAVISRGGGLNCSGFMVNNTAQDQAPLFMTARHCGVTSSNAASLVAYWNYETSVCDGTPDGTLDQFTSGSTWRSAYSPSDFTLVELSSNPDPAWGITYAGWDRTGADAAEAVAIHHPSVDEKRISFEYQPTTTTSYLGTSVPGDGTHVRVADWDDGTTEGGSSGSPLFNENHHVIGQLHGGYAACGNELADWYGKFSVSWTGGGTPSTRLSDWLDPIGTGQTTLNTLDPNNSSCNNDGTCDAGEDCNNCPGDCIGSSGGATCGNNVCETGAGEDCVSCPSDCNGVQSGNPRNRYCCGDGDGSNPVACGDSRCSAGGNSCSTGGSASYCCGDGACEGEENVSNCAIDCDNTACGDSVCDPGLGEDTCTCPADCGSPPPNETVCDDGIDEDCDDLPDCADTDCAGNEACPTCAPLGSSCSVNSDCCSNKCKGKSGSKTCK